jgi:hypothetical protein
MIKNCMIEYELITSIIVGYKMVNKSVERGH